jgi:predicted RNA-binding Zn-ribbon protein involved in translation (DUF1610 family)
VEEVEPMKLSPGDKKAIATAFIVILVGGLLIYGMATGLISTMEYKQEQKEDLIVCEECGWIGTHSQVDHKWVMVGKSSMVREVCPECGSSDLTHYRAV